MESGAVYHLIGADPWAHVLQESEVRTGDDVFVPNGTLQQSRIPSIVLESLNIICICLHCIYEVVSHVNYGFDATVN